MKELLKKGVDPNSDYYNQVHSAWTPLHAASSKNRCNTVELLAKWGADIEARDCDGDTPLHCARRNCKNCVEMLLSCRRAGKEQVQRYLQLLLILHLCHHCMIPVYMQTHFI